jgi:hypothetical protein
VPTFTVRNSRLREDGPILTVRVGSARLADEELRRAGHPVPVPVEVEALLDTGSGRSIIERELARSLKLMPVGSVEIDTPSSTDLPALEYWVRFWFDSVASVEAKVLEAPLPVPRIRALLGRDLMARARLAYDGVRGEFSLTV